MTIWAVLLAVFFGLLVEIATLKLVQRIVLQPMRKQLEDRDRRIASLETDGQILKALCDGTLDMSDLAETGLTRALEGGSTPRLDPDKLARLRKNVEAARGALRAHAKRPALPEPAPTQFTPNPFKRAPEAVRLLVPGDEVWISHVYVALDHLGVPHVQKDAETYMETGRYGSVRVRVYDNGSIQLGMKPDQVISSQVAVPDAWIPVSQVRTLPAGVVRFYPVTPGLACVRHPRRTQAFVAPARVTQAAPEVTEVTEVTEAGQLATSDAQGDRA